MSINAAVHSGGNDVILDALLLRLHTETACRRGALGLRLVDLDVHNGLIHLTKKGGTQRWQPVTIDLARRLANHDRVRGALLPTDALLRFRNGRPLTSRRYDQLWKRIGGQLPWVAVQGISTHWLRHTTLTWVERHFGYGIARAYAGHTDSTGTSNHHLHQRRHPRRRHRFGGDDRTPAPARSTERRTAMTAAASGTRGNGAVPLSGAVRVRPGTVSTPVPCIALHPSPRAPAHCTRHEPTPP